MSFKTLFVAGATAGLRFAKKHKRAILTGVTIGAHFYSLYKTWTMKDILIEKLEELEESGATNFEKVKGIAPIVAPVVIGSGITVGSSLLNLGVGTAEISSLVNSIALMKAYDKDKDKAIEEIDPDLTEKVKDKMNEKRCGDAIYKENPTRKFIRTGKGDDLFHDNLTNTWFYSSKNEIDKVINSLNMQLINEIKVTADEYCYDLSIPVAKSLSGKLWDIEHGQIRVHYTPKMLDSGEMYAEIDMIGNMPDCTDWRINR